MAADAKATHDSERERAKKLVRSILINDFKQNADDAVVDSVVEKILRALPPLGKSATRQSAA
jgi:hypothetical protein